LALKNILLILVQKYPSYFASKLAMKKMFLTSTPVFSGTSRHVQSVGKASKRLGPSRVLSGMKNL
jgi:hypothetical protein